MLAGSGRVGLPTGGQADCPADDVVDRRDLRRRLAARLELLGADAGGGSLVDGGAQAQARGADGVAHVVEQAARLGLARPAGRNSVEDAEESGVGRDGADHFDGGGHGLKVVDGGPARDDDEVGGWAERTTGRSDPRRSPQLAAAAYGSRSTAAADRPSRTAA